MGGLTKCPPPFSLKRLKLLQLNLVHLLKINQKLIKNIENVSILFKLSISMERLEIKMHFKKFHVKTLKSGF